MLTRWESRFTIDSLQTCLYLGIFYKSCSDEDTQQHIQNKDTSFYQSLITTLHYGINIFIPRVISSQLYDTDFIVLKFGLPEIKDARELETRSKEFTINSLFPSSLSQQKNWVLKIQPYCCENEEGNRV